MSESDCVYFLCGTTFTPSAYLNVTWSGTEANSVVIGAYYSDGGSPAAAVHGVNGDGRPIISGSTYTVPSKTSYLGMIHISSQDYVTVENLELYQTGGFGVAIIGDVGAGTNAAYCIVDNVKTNGTSRGGITVNKNSYNYATIKDCEVTKAGYIRMDGTESTQGAAIAITNNPYGNETVQRNYIYECWSEGVGIYQVMTSSAYNNCGYTTVEDNIFWKVAFSHIYIDTCHYNIVRRNLILGASSATLGGWISSTKFSNRYVDGRFWALTGIGISSEDRVAGAPASSNNAIYNNIVVGCYTGINFGIEYVGSSLNNVFYNNTLIGNRHNVSFNDALNAATITGTRFKNNVSVCPSDCNSYDARYNSAWIASDVDADYNSWHSQPTYWAGYNDVVTDSSWTRLTGWQSLTSPITDADQFAPLEIASVVGAAAPLESPYNLSIDKDSSWDIGPPLAIDIDTVTNQTDMGAVPFQGQGTPSSTGVNYVGWSTAAGVPATDPTSSVARTSDRLYLRKWTAAADGAAYSVRFFVGPTGWSSTNTWVVAYADISGNGDLTLVASVAIDDPSEADDWASEFLLQNAPGRADRLFESGVDIYFGFAVDAISWDAGRNETGGDGLYYTGTVVNLSGGPPAVIEAADIIVSAGADMAFVFGYATPSADTTDPVVVITAPTSDPYTATGVHSITVAGVATDVSGIATVEWETTHGNAAVAVVGSGEFEEDVPISAGATTITVKATDGAGNDTSESFVVNFAAPTASAVIGLTGASNPPTAAPASLDYKTACRHYFTEPAAAPAAGIIRGVYFYAGATWNPTAAWAIVYRKLATTYELLAFAAIESVAYSSHNFIPIVTPAPGKSLQFASGDELMAGIAVVASEGNPLEYGRAATYAAFFTSATFAGAPITSILISSLWSQGGNSPAALLCYEPVSADTTDPTVTITSHTTPYNAGTAQAITIAGTASDTSGIVAVTWSDDQGHSGTASGTTNWIIADAALVIGITIFTIEAEDGAGNTNTAELTVQRVAAVASRLPKIYDGDKTTVAMTYTSDDPVGEWKWIQYKYKLEDLIDRALVWTPDALRMVVALSLDGETWEYYGGTESNELDENGRLVLLDDEDAIETRYVMMYGGGCYNLPLPQATVAQRGRLWFWVEGNGQSVDINELRIVREVVAEQIYAENIGAISADLGIVSAGKLYSQTLGATTGIMMDLNDGYTWYGGTSLRKIQLDGRVGSIFVQEGGKIVVGDDNVTIDSTDIGDSHGRIEIAPNGGKAGQDYVLIDNGNLYQMAYLAGAHRKYNFLSRSEGPHEVKNVPQTGLTVQVPGYWRRLPKIVPQASNFVAYNAAYPSQSQRVICRAENTRWRAGYPGQVDFTARAHSEIAEASVLGTGTVSTAVTYAPTSTSDFPARTMLVASVASGCQRVELTYAHAACSGWVWMQNNSVIMRRSYAVRRTLTCQIYYSGAWHTIASDTYDAYTDWNDRIVRSVNSGWVGANITSYRVVMSAGTVSETTWQGSDLLQYLDFTYRREYLSSTPAAVSGDMIYVAME
jgi:hypothetical protein